MRKGYLLFTPPTSLLIKRIVMGNVLFKETMVAINAVTVQKTVNLCSVSNVQISIQLGF